MCIVVFSTFTVFMKEVAWRKEPRRRINGYVVIKLLNTRKSEIKLVCVRTGVSLPPPPPPIYTAGSELNYFNDDISAGLRTRIIFGSWIRIRFRVKICIWILNRV